MKARINYMEVTKEGALNLLESMLTESAMDFEGGVLAYLSALEAEQKAIKSFKKSCEMLANARRRKYNALQVVIPEYAFLMGKENVKPPIDGKVVVPELIMKIIREADADMYAEIAEQFLGDEK